MWFAWLALAIDAPVASLITPFGWFVLIAVASIPMACGAAWEAMT